MKYSEAIKGGWKTKAGLIALIAWTLAGKNLDLSGIYEPGLLLIELFFGAGITHKAVKINRVRKEKKNEKISDMVRRNQ